MYIEYILETVRHHCVAQLLSKAVDGVAKVDCDCYRPEADDAQRKNFALYKENRDIRLCVDFDGVGEQFCSEGGAGWNLDNVIRLQVVQVGLAMPQATKQALSRDSACCPSTGTGTSNMAAGNN